MAGREPRAAPLEWAAAAAGSAIFLALFGTIFRQGMERPVDQPPQLSIEDRRTVSAPGGALVEFRVRNHSNRTAAAVVVEGRLGGQPAAQVTIDYVPARSSVAAGMIVPPGGRADQLAIRAVGYRLP